MKYQRHYEVRFSETDRRSQLTPIALYNYFQDAAINHGESVGLSSDELGERGYAWMINRIHIEFDRLPRRSEQVAVETWAHTLTGLYAVREWVARDAAGVALARATSRWILFDLNKKKIVRLPEFMPAMYGEHAERAVENDFARMKPIGEDGLQKRFHVRASELDTNQHANSACYVDWMLESVPDEVLLDWRPRALEITYKKESKIGQTLCVASREAPADDTALAFDHTIRLESSGDVSTLGRSVWTRA